MPPQDGGLSETAYFSRNASRYDPAMRDHTWYVTFEVPKTGRLTKRRNPRLTQTFQTEAEAKDFAREKFGEGRVVSAGTIIPNSPRRIITPTSIPAWLDPDEKQA